MKRIKSNPSMFRDFNAPQRAAIEAALSRRLTLIQGPPGTGSCRVSHMLWVFGGVMNAAYPYPLFFLDTGKTVVAAAIGYGFAHQCRSISTHTKVLACAFSNVGADNLAEALLRLGLKVVRVGKPSAVSESLWDHTLEAAIHRDPDAQKALKAAAWATAQLGKLQKSRGDRDGGSNQAVRDAATSAVKASIQVLRRGRICPLRICYSEYSSSFRREIRLAILPLSKSCAKQTLSCPLQQAQQTVAC
jgi:AAA domain